MCVAGSAVLEYAELCMGALLIVKLRRKAIDQMGRRGCKQTRYSLHANSHQVIVAAGPCFQE